jgi:RIO-like serine/threonine protein kinase
VKLIRYNNEKQRAVYFCGDSYKKIWYNVDPVWIEKHVEDLNLLLPGYVLEHGNNWIRFKVVEGTPASEFPHTLEFVEKIHNFCLSQILETTPMYHGDWTLSNIIINGDEMTMIDWDNLGSHPIDQVYKKLASDLKSAFGELYVF